MKFSLFISGCQYNYYDAKNITHFLIKMGYIFTKNENQADIIVVLACSVRQKPIDRVFGKLKLWQKLVKKPKIIVCGCILPNDFKKIKTKVNLITNTQNFNTNFKKYFRNKIKNNKIYKCNLNFIQRGEKNKTAYIPIMQGCNNFCTYCAVPYTRGREISRRQKDIIAEVKKELSLGKKYIILLGQNVCSYSNNFSDLIKKIDKIPNDFTFNFTSANPRNFNNELINTLPKLEKWQKILHLPLQSGDDKILKKMNRKYTAEQYFRIITKLKSLIPTIRFTTDIIVGFPGETNNQFSNTVKICKKINFNKVYVAQYSPRPGTAAEKLDDNISSKTKKQRWKTINELINKTS